jgi:hypothetical protein
MPFIFGPPADIPIWETIDRECFLRLERVNEFFGNPKFRGPFLSPGAEILKSRPATSPKFDRLYPVRVSEGVDHLQDESGCSRPSARAVGTGSSAGKPSPRGSKATPLRRKWWTTFRAKPREIPACPPQPAIRRSGVLVSEHNRRS